MRQPHHAGRYSIDELEMPADLLTENETEEVKGGSEWTYVSTGPSLYGPLLPISAVSVETAPASRED
jgi:hypothetical protein